MKRREFPDGSYQFLPEPEDPEYPTAPVLPEKTPRLLALEANEAAINASNGPVQLKVDLAELKELRRREEAQHTANVAAFDRTKPPANFPAAAAGSGARVLTPAEIREADWLKSNAELVRLGKITEDQAAARSAKKGGA